MSRFAPRCKQFKCENCVTSTAQREHEMERYVMKRGERPQK